MKGTKEKINGMVKRIIDNLSKEEFEVLEDFFEGSFKEDGSINETWMWFRSLPLTSIKENYYLRKTQEEN
tara:strand:- start:541 stop:750 length:210 start_codon:yes stop_codon:yes gene_type:complete